MLSPFFSVIIPTYNRPDLLRRALESVLLQSYTDWEAIIVDDGSTKELNDYKLLYNETKFLERCSFYNKSNGGAASARNFGIEKAKGKYICFLDDDDEFLQRHLEILFDRIKKENYALGIYRTLAYINTNGNFVEQAFTLLPDSASAMERLYANVLLTCEVAISAQIFKDYSFDLRVPISEDYELWTRILLRYAFFEEQAYTVKYNIHQGSLSSGDDTLVHKKHIITFRHIFALKGVRRSLPLKFRTRLLSNRYLWLAAAEKSNGYYIKFAGHRLTSAYYYLINFLDGIIRSNLFFSK